MLVQPDSDKRVTASLAGKNNKALPLDCAQDINGIFMITDCIS